jgi:hypothetical protein
VTVKAEEGSSTCALCGVETVCRVAVGDHTCPCCPDCLLQARKQGAEALLRSALEGRIPDEVN